MISVTVIARVIPGSVFQGWPSPVVVQFATVVGGWMTVCHYRQSVSESPPQGLECGKDARDDE